MRSSLTLLLLLTTAFVRADDSPKEPTVDGKPVSAWVAQLSSMKPDERKTAADSIRSAGKLSPEVIRAIIESAYTERGENVDAVQLLVDLAPASIPHLLTAAWDMSTERRLIAMKALGLMDFEARGAKGVMVEALSDPDDRVRFGAAQVLRMTQSYSALPSLVQAAGKGPTMARVALATEAVQLGAEAKDVLPILLEAFKNEDNPALGLAASEAIGFLGQEAADAAPAFSKLIEKDPRYVAMLARSIGNLGPAAAPVIPAIKKAYVAEPKLERFVHFVAEALWKSTRDPEAVAMLKAVLKPEKLPSTAAASLWWELDGSPDALASLIRCVDKLPNAEANEAVMAIGRIGAPAKAAVPVLVARLDRISEFDIGQAAASLARIGPGAKEALAKLKTLVDHESEYVRVAVRSAIASIDATPAALASLEEMLQSRDRNIRLAAANRFEVLGPKAAAVVPALRKALESADDDEIRFNLAQALWAIAKHEDATAALRKLLGSTPSPSRNNAISVLAINLSGDGAKVMPLLLPILWEPSANEAAEALGRLGPAAKEAVPQMTALLASDVDTPTLSAAAEALGLMGPEAKRAIPVLRERLSYPDPYVRACAALSLWLLAREAPEVKQIEALMRSRNPRARIVAAELLWRVKQDPKAIDALTHDLGNHRLYEDGDSLNLVYMAARALGRIGPPAKKALPDLNRLRTHLSNDTVRAANAAIQAIDGPAPKKKKKP